MKIIGVGLNYQGQLQGKETPPEPIIFFKQDTSILVRNKPFYHPSFTKKINYEVEIVIKIDKPGKNIAEKFAHKYYSEYGLCIDFTAADLIAEAREKGLPWDLAKGFNDALPLSTFHPISELKSIDNLNFSLLINNKEVQKANTSEMLFSVDQIIAYVSKYIFLKKGDIILTGTPAGVAPINIGDRLTGYIEDRKLLDFEIR